MFYGELFMVFTKHTVPYVSMDKKHRLVFTILTQLSYLPLNTLNSILKLWSFRETRSHCLLRGFAYKLF
jgi:hypothetical protein